MQDVLHTERNPYDKIGHFMQGFVPAMVAREILLRRGYVTGRAVAGFLSVCFALAVSAVYEMIEWWAALAMGQGASDFLGTQGDPWDTQSDMFFALIGSTVAIVALSRFHDRLLLSLSWERVKRKAGKAGPSQRWIEGLSHIDVDQLGFVLAACCRT